MQVVQASLAVMMTDIIATAAALDPAATWVGVATAIAAQGVQTTMANVTEATGGLATRVKVTTWSAVYPLTTGAPAVDGPICTFTPGGSDPAQQLTYWFLATASTAGALIAYGTISPAIIITGGGAPLKIVPRVTITTTGVTDVSQVWDG